MRGHIVKRSKDSYTVVVSLGRDPTTGKRKQHWQSVKGSKKDAERMLAETLNGLDKGGFVKPTAKTVAEFLKLWLKDYAATNTAPRTGERYSEIVHLHLIPHLGAIPLTKLRPDHLQAYYAKELTQGRLDGKGGLSPQTVLHHHRVLSDALNHAVKWGLVARNVAQAVDPPRPRKKEMTTLSPEDSPTFFEQARRLERNSGLPYYAIFLTALHTGMRRGEFLGLRWKDIDLDMATISVNRSLQRLRDGSLVFREPKTPKARRQIAMTPSLATELRGYKTEQQAMRILIGKPLSDEDMVFARPDGSPINPETVTPSFKKIAHHLGLNLRLHDLRHTHASLMLKAGVHPKVVSERLGHATVGITLDTYSHVTPGLDQMAALRFEDGLARQVSPDRAGDKISSGG